MNARESYHEWIMHRRERIATAVFASLVGQTEEPIVDATWFASQALHLADALMKELEKPL